MRAIFEITMTNAHIYDNNLLLTHRKAFVITDFIREHNTDLPFVDENTFTASDNIQWISGQLRKIRTSQKHTTDRFIDGLEE